LSATAARPTGTGANGRCRESAACSRLGLQEFLDGRFIRGDEAPPGDRCRIGVVDVLTTSFDATVMDDVFGDDDPDE
jgi:hypothetical protein